jgi:crotonobetainyl-CoA:carnitine CoA-transferase CaiB-like acyl-CoA transferase
VWVERLWLPFCAALERPELATDPRFAVRDDRLRHRGELVRVLEPIFRTRTVKEWMARLEGREVLCAPVNRYADLPTDPQVVASRMLVPEDHPRAGRLTTLDTPIRYSRTPGGIRTHAPALGEHTDAVLTEAGLAPAELARLRETKVIA